MIGCTWSLGMSENLQIFFFEDKNFGRMSSWGGAAYIGKLGHGFKPPVSIHIPIWCVMDFPSQWGVEVDIFGVLLGLVHNDR